MTTTPAPTDLDTLKALEQAATPAPWAVQSEGGYIVRDTNGTVVAEAYGAKDVADAAFIAAVRNGLPVLSERMTEQAYELSQVHEDNQRLAGELAKTRAELDEARTALRDADTWIERVGMTTEAVIILAEDKTPGLALLADLALWNDRRRALLADANPATTAEPAAEPKAELCTDKNGLHGGHDWRPDPSGGLIWCHGLPATPAQVQP